MPRPIIGITTYGQDDAGRFTLPREYVDAVRRAGGFPVLLPPGEGAAEALEGRVDGLLLSGGGDLEATSYGGTQHPSIYNVDPERDETELDLARRALEVGLPFLAICRGLQIVNVALGGTLFEHLPDVVGERVIHRAPPRDPIGHSVRIEPGSRLAGILETCDLEVSSWHHQAIRKLGSGLSAVASAADGTIEAVESEDHPRLLAVQWHPELSAESDPHHQRLFDVLVQMHEAGE